MLTDKFKNFFARPESLLFLLAAAMPLAFYVWHSLLNNFAVERAAFTGVEIGTLQSIREIPGFLSFTVVFLLFFVREQRLLILASVLMGVGTAITGYFPSVIGLYITTVIMSTGFHYYEAVNQSLSLQWFPKETAAQNLGRMLSVGSMSSLGVFLGIYVLLEWFAWDMTLVYLLGGCLSVLIGVIAWFKFPMFEQEVEQHKKLILRRRYWLYYALTFMAGARRQIFIVFAAFLMVEKFNFSASDLSILFFINGVMTMIFAPKIGKLIGYWGERKALTVEYIGLILIFIGYALVENAWFAGGLYVLDHILFSMAIAMKTYFQKIADPKDMAPTAGIAFTINHIAAVILPVVYGLIWVNSPDAVFLTAAVLAGGSLILSRLIPLDPRKGYETVLTPA